MGSLRPAIWFIDGRKQRRITLQWGDTLMQIYFADSKTDMRLRYEACFQSSLGDPFRRWSSMSLGLHRAWQGHSTSKARLQTGNVPTKLCIHSLQDSNPSFRYCNAYTNYPKQLNFLHSENLNLDNQLKHLSVLHEQKNYPQKTPAKNTKQNKTKPMFFCSCSTLKQLELIKYLTLHALTHAHALLNIQPYFLLQRTCNRKTCKRIFSTIQFILFNGSPITLFWTVIIVNLVT